MRCTEGDQSTVSDGHTAERVDDCEGAQCETDQLLALASGVSAEGILGLYANIREERITHRPTLQCSQTFDQSEIPAEKETTCESEEDRIYMECLKDSENLRIHRKSNKKRATKYCAAFYATGDFHKLGDSTNREDTAQPIKKTLTDSSESQCVADEILYKCLPHWFALQHLGQDGLAARVTHCINVVSELL